MALKRIELTADLTSTSGTGTYTMTDPASPGAGLRTLADAVADGDVAAGDTVYYFVVDTTTEGGALEWEHGIGTVGAGGASLARTEIINGSNGTSEVSWENGGSRSVRFGMGLTGLAVLAAANTFTAAQTITANNVFGLAVDRSGSLGGLSVGSSLSSGKVGAVRLFGHNASGADVVYAELSGAPTDATAGSEDGRLWLTLVKAGAQVDVARIEGTGDYVNNVTGQTGAYQGVLSAPSGGRILWGTSTIPAGWTLVTSSVDDRAVLLTDTAIEAGDISGSWFVSGLTVADVPDHSHTTGVAGSSFVRGWVSGDPGPTNYLTSSTDPDKTSATAFATSTGASVDGASVSVASDGAWRMSYRKMILINKT